MSRHADARPRRPGAIRAGALVASDLRHMVRPRRPQRSMWVLEATAKLLLFPRIRAVVLYRVSQVLSGAGLLPVAYAVQARVIRGSGAEISPLASIGPGLCLMHSVGIVVGPDVVIGRNARIYQGVTLGDGPSPGQPTVGDDVTIGCNAAVLGGVRVGDRVVIGANAVVTRDVPDDCVARGAPAQWYPRATTVPTDGWLEEVR